MIICSTSELGFVIKISLPTRKMTKEKIIAVEKYIKKLLEKAWLVTNFLNNIILILYRQLIRPFGLFI